MDYLSLFVCYVCAVSVSELLVTPNNLKSVLHPPAELSKIPPVLQNGSTKKKLNFYFISNRVDF
jgi:hypothetical protein